MAGDARACISGVGWSVSTNLYCMVIIRMETKYILYTWIISTFLTITATDSENSGRIIKLLVQPGQIVSVLDSDMFSKIFKDDIKIVESSREEPFGRLKVDKTSKIFNLSSSLTKTIDPPATLVKQDSSVTPPPYYITVNPPLPELPRRSLPLPPQPPVISKKSFSPYRSRSPPSIGQIIRDIKNFKKGKLDRWRSRLRKKENPPYPYTVTYPATLYPDHPTLPILYTDTATPFQASELDINIINNTKHITLYQGR